MAKTLLDCVNEVLKRAKIIDTANVGLLTSLTNSALQHEIDMAVQVVNEGVDELYSGTNVEIKVQAESTIVLVNGQREYSLASDLVRLKWPMIDRVNTQYLYEWTEGYDALLELDPQQLYTGLPIWGMISPITNMLRTDRAPDSTSAGHTYYYEYEKDTVMSAATDTVPFSNACFRSMVPAWVQLWKKEKMGEFDVPLYAMNLGRAARFLREGMPSTTYNPRR